MKLKRVEEIEVLFCRYLLYILIGILLGIGCMMNEI